MQVVWLEMIAQCLREHGTPTPLSLNQLGALGLQRPENVPKSSTLGKVLEQHGASCGLVVMGKGEQMLVHRVVLHTSNSLACLLALAAAECAALCCPEASACSCLSPCRASVALPRRGVIVASSEPDLVPDISAQESLKDPFRLQYLFGSVEWRPSEGTGTHN